MRRTLVDRLAERITEPAEGPAVDLTAALLAPAIPYAPRPQAEPPACGAPIVAGELVLPDWDLMLRQTSS